MDQKKANLDLDYINKNSVDQIITGYFNPSKNMIVTDLKNHFAKEITIIIDAYFGATNGTSIVTIQECLSIFIENYSFLSVFELKNAAKYLIFNQMQKEVKNKTFYGQFTCSLFVEMIEKYLSYRNKVLLIMREKEKEIEKQNEEKIREEKMKIEFESIAEKWMQERIRLNDLENFNDITPAMAIYFSKLIPDDEKLKTESILIAKDQMKSERLNHILKGDRIKANELMFIIERSNLNEINTIANSIYMRLKVFNHIKNNVILKQDDQEKTSNPEKNF